LRAIKIHDIQRFRSIEERERERGERERERERRERYIVDTLYCREIDRGYEKHVKGEIRDSARYIVEAEKETT